MGGKRSKPFTLAQGGVPGDGVLLGKNRPAEEHSVVAVRKFSNGFVDVGSTTTIDGILCLNGTLTSPTVAIGQPGLLTGNGTINGDLSNAGTISAPRVFLS